MRRAVGLGLAGLAAVGGAVWSAVSGEAARAVELEGGPPLVSPVPRPPPPFPPPPPPQWPVPRPNPQFPAVFAQHGRQLSFHGGDDAAQALREAVDRHEWRPLLVLVVPNDPADPGFGSAAHRVTWLGNVLSSPDESVQRSVAGLGVAVATPAQLRTVLQEVKPEALAYLIGRRDGRPFAWMLAATNPAPAETAVAELLARRPAADIAAVARACRDRLDPAERARLEKAVAELGDDDFAKREAASRDLAARMADIAPWIAAVESAATDAEVRVRCGRLLTGAGRLWRELPPAGCRWSDAPPPPPVIRPMPARRLRLD